MKECPACKLCFPDDVSRCPNDGDATIHSITGDPVLDGRYQLMKRLGQGGMGVVYKARHSYLKTSHAIKVILPDLVGNDPNLVTRFRQEALAAAAIRHRNIVSVTDFGVVAGKMPFLVMEYIEGEALHDLLVREKRLPPAMAFQILSAICSGLGAAHRQDIVHRDLKPLNIMIQRGAPIDEAIKLLDFGLAKIKSGELLGSFIQAQTTGLMGSPYYMAPEQWSDDEPDARADVYSLGVILYQMLAGDVPFKGSSIPSIMRKHLTDPPPPFTDIGLKVSPSIEEVVRHALEKDPEKRTPSVNRLIEELREAIANPNAKFVSGVAPQVDDMLLTAPIVPRPEAKVEKAVKPPPAQKVFAAVGEPAAVLRILSNPPQSSVFLDGDKLGATEASGWLVVENIRRGKHRLRVIKDGFAAWETEINCEGEMCQTVAQLTTLAPGNAPVKTEAPTENLKVVEAVHPARNVVLPENQPPANVPAMPDLDLSIPLAPTTKGEEIVPQPFGLKSYPEVRHEEAKPEGRREQLKPQTEETKPEIKFETVKQQQTLKSLPDSSRIHSAALPAVENEKKNSSKTFLLIAAALVVCLTVVAGAGYAAYQMMLASPAAEVTAPTKQTNNPPAENPTNTVPPVETRKAEMIKIPGGSFQMGAATADGQDLARPAHTVTVNDFWMDKFEVTNAEYAKFVEEAKHRAPANWINGKFLPEEEMLPVTAVSLDDAKAFAAWRSKRDGAQYRLPTEQEWEYAARNGSEENLYPWGDKWENGKAVMGKLAAQAVGSSPEGANKWGVQDLIGNVWEWTETSFATYPGNTQLKVNEGGFAARGGSFHEKPDSKPASINAIFRNAFEPTKRDNRIGFRLVRAGS